MINFIKSFRTAFYFCIFTLIFQNNLIAQRITSGPNFSTVICNSGFLKSWGHNIDGRLGNDTISLLSLPVTPHIYDIVQVVAGGSGANGYSLAVKDNGTVWAWGGNAYGNLGDGTLIDKPLPFQVNTLSGITDVSICCYQVFSFSMALKNDGTVWTWGDNGSGSIGDSSLIDRYSPVQVPNLTNVKQISAGGTGQAVVLKEDGTVWAWGENTQGQLGNGTTVDNPYPIQILGLDSIISISTGVYHTLALRADKTVWVWGYNLAGALGDSTFTGTLVPMKLTSINDVEKVYAGNSNSFALKSDQTVWAWGFNNFGQLGDGTQVDRASPVQTLLSNVADVAPGQTHTIVLMLDGTVWSFGNNSTGQLGDGTNVNRVMPAMIAGLCYVPNPNTVFDHHLSGTIYHDLSNDCVDQLAEYKFPQIFVVATPGNIYGMTDSIGKYNIGLFDSINYSITPLPPPISAYSFGTACPIDYNNVTLTGSDPDDTTGFDFGYSGDLCFQLSVDIGTNRKRACFQNQTIVSYLNDGFISAYNVTIHVKFDQYDFPLSASLPYTLDPTDSSIVFSIDSLNPFETGTITIIDSVACSSSLLNLTQCTKTWILPVNQCLIDSTTGNGWDESDLYVTGHCYTDTIEFIISNIGIGDMNSQSEYRIYADNILMLTGNFQLPAGDSLVITYVPNGATIRLEADQTPGHPGISRPRTTIEGCGTNTSGGFTTNQVNAAPMDDEDINIEIDCRPITGSFDPNDKTNSPLGIDADHIVLPGTSIDYMIRFQNTGNDTAFRVILEDTLSNDFDLSTLQFGISSHPYTTRITGQGLPVLRFTFENINLPDSNINEPGSNGFVKFKISPKSTVPLGTRISNYADIYFDYNDPVRTNESFVTLGNYLQVGVLENVSIKNELTLFPNPFEKTTTLNSSGKENMLSLNIFSIDGKLKIKKILNPTQTEVTLDLGELSPGVYFINCIYSDKTASIKAIKY